MHFTFRPLILGGQVFTPAAVFANAFVGLDITFEAMCGDNATDGRYLGWWRYDGEIDLSEIEEVVAEALAAFAYHPKTDVTALDFAKTSTKRNDLSIVDGRVAFPEKPDV